MTAQATDRARGRNMQKSFITLAAMATLVLPLNLSAQELGFGFGFLPIPQLFPGNLVVSRSVYDNQASNVTVR